jgi:RNA polymerase sigma-70 factor, ECF subfamily
MRSEADSERLESLFRTHYPAVLAYARRRAPRSVADDVAAETFTIAWRRADAIPDEPLPWLLGVARRVLATQRRSQARRLRLQQRLRTADASSSGEPSELEGRLGQALAALSERDREAILLIAWEGLTTKQAASVLGVTATGLGVRLHRARRRLRAHLDRISERMSSEPARPAEPLRQFPATKGNAP